MNLHRFSGISILGPPRGIKTYAFCLFWPWTPWVDSHLDILYRPGTVSPGLSPKELVPAQGPWASFSFQYGLPTPSLHHQTLWRLLVTFGAFIDSISYPQCLSDDRHLLSVQQ